MRASVCKHLYTWYILCNKVNAQNATSYDVNQALKASLLSSKNT